MGGEHSGIGDATTTVLLEGAFWNPAVIQGRSRRLGFVSDAGFRFERGVDFGNCARAVERATQLILEICGGRAGPLGDVTGALPRARRRARAPGARHATPRHRRCRRDDSHAVRAARTRVHARRRRFHRHAADLALRPRDRGGLRRGNRAPRRLRRDPGQALGARADDAARPGNEALVARSQAPARRARLAGSDHVQLRELGARGHALSGPPVGRRADRRAESDRDATST